jgi:hypothetical protein
VTHHTVGGCNLRSADLLGTGTISSPVSQSSLTLNRSARHSLRHPCGSFGKRGREEGGGEGAYGSLKLNLQPEAIHVIYYVKGTPCRGWGVSKNAAGMHVVYFEGLHVVEWVSKDAAGMHVLYVEGLDVLKKPSKEDEGVHVNCVNRLDVVEWSPRDCHGSQIGPLGEKQGKMGGL